MSKKLRRDFPTFASYNQRRHERPKESYDTMRCPDSWLAAHLTDHIIQGKFRDHELTVRDISSAGAWRRTFNGVMQGLEAKSWGACVAFYLHAQQN